MRYRWAGVVLAAAVLTSTSCSGDGVASGATTAPTAISPATTMAAVDDSYTSTTGDDDGVGGHVSTMAGEVSTIAGEGPEFAEAKVSLTTGDGYTFDVSFRADLGAPSIDVVHAPPGHTVVTFPDAWAQAEVLNTTAGRNLPQQPITVIVTLPGDALPGPIGKCYLDVTFCQVVTFGVGDSQNGPNVPALSIGQASSVDLASIVTRGTSLDHTVSEDVADKLASLGADGLRDVVSFFMDVNPEVAVDGCANIAVWSEAGFRCQ